MTTKSTTYTDQYTAADLRAIKLSRRAVPVTVDHVTTTVIKRYAEADLTFADGTDAEEHKTEIEITAAEMNAAVVTSGIAAKLLAAANAKLGG